jgi:thioredoxin reductase
MSLVEPRDCGQARGMDSIWDCVVVGGGAAGLSAGLVLGRARRRTLLVDAGRQSNLPSHGVGGLLGHDGRSPAELYEIGRREIAAYPSVELRSGEVVDGARVGDAFELKLADGGVERTRRVLLPVLRRLGVTRSTAGGAGAG